MCVTFLPLYLFTRDALGRTSEAEHPSQDFTFLGSLKLVRHVSCYSNSGQILQRSEMTLSATSRHHAYSPFQNKEAAN
jgi:hypothetical protein